MCTVPWKHCPTSSPTVTTIPYFFLWNFPILLPFFICKSTHFYIWKCTLDLKTVPHVVTNSEHHCWAHQCTLQPCPSDCNRCKKNDKFFAGTRTPDTPTDQKNISLPPLFHKIYSKAMPAQKYISKVWQWHLRVHPPKIYPYCISLTKYILQPWHRHYNFCVTFQGPWVKNIFLIRGVSISHIYIEYKYKPWHLVM